MVISHFMIIFASRLEIFSYEYDRSFFEAAVCDGKAGRCTLQPQVQVLLLSREVEALSRDLTSYYDR